MSLDLDDIELRARAWFGSPRTDRVLRPDFAAMRLIRTDVPALVAEVRRLEERLADSQDLVRLALAADPPTHFVPPDPPPPRVTRAGSTIPPHDAAGGGSGPSLTTACLMGAAAFAGLWLAILGAP